MKKGNDQERFRNRINFMILGIRFAHDLFGGCNPSEKSLPNWVHLPQTGVQKKKHFELPPPSYFRLNVFFSDFHLVLSFIQWHQLRAPRIFVAATFTVYCIFRDCQWRWVDFLNPGHFEVSSSKSSIADPKWHLRWWKNILHTGQFVVNSLILLPYQLGSHHISCANRVSLLKSFLPKVSFAGLLFGRQTDKQLFHEYFGKWTHL